MNNEKIKVGDQVTYSGWMCRRKDWVVRISEDGKDLGLSRMWGGNEVQIIRVTQVEGVEKGEGDEKAN